MKRGVNGQSLGVFQRRRLTSNERRPRLIGRSLKSDRKSHGRETGESDLKGWERQGRRQVRRARFINNGRMVVNDEHKESSDVIGPNSKIGAKHGFASGIQASAQKN